MKNTSVFLVMATIILSSCETKKETTSAVEPITALEGSKAVKVELSDYDRYEGKIVEASTGQWFLIKEGARWRTNSVKSSDDYLKKLPIGPDYVAKNVPIEILRQFPEVGELLPNVEFKKDEKISVK
jgi:predicted heme/steroid binding protein